MRFPVLYQVEVTVLNMVMFVIGPDIGSNTKSGTRSNTNFLVIKCWFLNVIKLVIKVTEVIRVIGVTELINHILGIEFNGY